MILMACCYITRLLARKMFYFGVFNKMVLVTKWNMSILVKSEQKAASQIFRNRF